MNAPWRVARVGKDWAVLFSSYCSSLEPFTALPLGGVNG